MTPFNNELQVGQPAMIINVEYSKNIHRIGQTIIVTSLISPEEASFIFESNGHAYASHDYEGSVHYIRQKFLMPLPPLGDVYDQEMMDEMQNHKVTAAWIG